jgi:FtsH-binding integral membrane protein
MEKCRKSIQQKREEIISMLALYSVGSLILLAFALWLLWRTIRTETNLRWIGIWTAFIVLALPLLYMLYKNVEIVDANIGLGLSFFFTWIVTMLLLLIAGIRLFIQKKARD